MKAAFWSVGSGKTEEKGKEGIRANHRHSNMQKLAGITDVWKRVSPNADHRGSGFSKFARAYAVTATTAAFSANSFGTILSRVSAAVWW